MKRYAAFLILVAAGCRTVPLTTAVGASTPRGAVEQMLAAAAAQDLQAISAVWGSEAGLARDNLDRAEVESRTFIMACVLRSDSRQFRDPTPAGNGRVFVPVDLTQGTNKGSTRFETARTRDGRWLVANVELQTLQNSGFCTR